MFDFSPTISRLSVLGATQIEMEELYSKSQLMDALREDFVQNTAEIEALNIPAAFGIDLLAQMALHKRATPETLIGLLRHHFKDQANPDQACADMLLHACACDLADMDEILDSFTEITHFMIVVRYEVSEAVQARIDRFQYPLPMIEEPQQVRHNRDTGYRTIKGSVILKKNHHDEDVCLDHINRLNRQRLRLNPDAVAFVQNSWKGLSKPKDGESFQQFRERQQAFMRYDTVSRDVIDAMLLQSDGFWLTHRYDKRGRTYCQGYQINYQGSDWNKACVEFYQAEKLNH